MEEKNQKEQLRQMKELYGGEEVGGMMKALSTCSVKTVKHSIQSFVIKKKSPSSLMM